MQARALAPLALLLGAALLAGCKGQARELRTDPAAAATLDDVELAPQGHSGALPAVVALDNSYESNAYQLSEGKRLYSWFNCGGCHAQGGGGTGPALIDGYWLYGADLVDLVATIRDGRPNGMPAFRDKLPIEQIWQLAGYVQSLGQMVGASYNAPSRDDRLQARPAENRAPAAMPGDASPVNSARD